MLTLTGKWSRAAIMLLSLDTTAIKGKPLTDVWFAFAQLKPYESQLTGQLVTRIETRGKALLTHFSNGLTLYSHNQLYGVWRVIDTGEIPQTTRILRVRLQTADKTILLSGGTGELSAR